MTYNIAVQWPLVLFSLIAGSGGALAAFIGLSELTGRAREGRFLAAVVALALMVVGGCCSVAHLSLPQNMFAAATNIFSFSGVSLELIMLGITFIVVLAYAIVVKREASAAAAKVLAVVGLVAGLLLAFVTGHGYVIEARPLWNTEILPLAYLCSVLPVGGFLYVAIAKAKGATEEDLAFYSPLLLVAAVLSAVAMVAYLLFVGDVAAADPAASYFAVVVCGVVGVLACAAAAFAMKGRSAVAAVAAVAVVLACVGGVGLRALMWDASEPYFNAFYLEANDINIGVDGGLVIE